MISSLTPKSNVYLIKNLISRNQQSSITSNNHVRFFKTVRTRFESTTTNKIAADSQTKLSQSPSPIRKTKYFRKFFLYSTLISGGAYFAYYQFYLNDQEKRKVGVKIASLGRALRLDFDK